jgi:Concanavalin A-like lectin/glucanases superfamily
MLLVLIAVAVATILSMSFLASQATSLGVAQNVQGNAQARSVAESALVIAINYVQTDTGFRTDKTHGQWVAGASFNGGTFDLYGYDGLDTDGDGVVDDTDGDLADDNSDPVTLKVVANVDGVSHTVYAVVTAGGGSPTQTVLMIVADTGSLDPKEQGRKDLMEGWGWAVNTLGDGASQADYDAAVAVVDGVLVPNTVSAGAVGTKLNNASVGVVIEQSGLADDLKMSTSSASYGDTSISVTNGSHFITSVFGSGLLQVATTSGNLEHPAGTLASGALSLASPPTGSASVVVVLETGAALEGGGIAAGRRVSIPTGGFAVTDLTDDGKTLIKRALTWTGGGDADGFLSGRWALDETSGLTAYDSSGNGQNGPITAGNPSTQWTSGKVFGGLRFDGSGDGFIRIPDSNVLDLTTEGTLSAWIYLDGYKNFMGIIHKGEFKDWSDEAYSLQFWTSRKLALTFTTSSGTKKIVGSQQLQDGQWYHVAGTWGTNGMALYVNGALDASNSITAVGVPSIGSVQIGSQLSEYYNSSDKNLPFIGVIDDARIYRRTLTAAEIADEYNQAVETSDSPQLIALYEFQESVPPPPALVGHWKLDGQVLTTGLDVLLVVADASSPTPQDSAKKALIESWGNTVTLISDDDTQANFDTAAALVDVAYVTEEVSSSTVGTKLRGATIGVVNEEKGLMDEFGFSSSSGTFTSDSIEIDNVSHYITQTFTVGDHLTILTSSSALIRSLGSTGGGVTTLATRTTDSDKVLTVLDTGGAMYGGGNAPGRRVQLPWGDDAFDFSLLATDGQTIMKRSLEWAAAGRAIDEIAANHGQVKNGVTQGQPGNGDGGTAFQFDGVGGYVEVPHDNAYLLNDGSVSFWFKPDALSGHQGLVSKDSKYYDTGGHLHVYTEGSTLKARIQSTDTSYTLQSSGLSVGNWYHVVVSFGSGEFKLYRDGVLVDSDSYTGGIGSSSGGIGNHEPMVFGAGTWTSDDLLATPITYPFDGSIDDVRIYDRGLDDTQALDLYNGVTPGSGPATVVYDTGSFGSPLNLNIQDPGNVTWLPGGGLQIDAATQIVSPTAATKLYTALTATNQISLEVAFTPADTSQNGPARIVTYSGGASSRNFTLGQEDDTYVTRLRTDTTTGNGTPDISSPSVLAAGTQEHVVVSYDGTNVIVYRNGAVDVTAARTGDFNWDSTFKLILGDELTSGYDWLGQIHRVAIYDKVFNAAQAANVFNGLPPGDGTNGTGGVDWVEP